MSEQARHRVLSGIQPSGNLTIGNYLGAIQQWVAYQDTYDAYYCVVDLHAITVDHDPQELRQKTREVAAIYIASGLDPEKATIFVQSHVKEHAELAWLLTCQTPLGWLYRMTQFKDKSAKQSDDASISTGLLSYPVLMAADILLYQAEKVPVGDDQRQHVELTRDIAQRFNHRYSEVFTIPEAVIPPIGARVMGLDTPLAKMSKSEAAQGHAVYILDEPKVASKKIMRAVTDSGRDITFSDDPERAGVNNLLSIYQAFTGKDKAAVEADFENARGYGDLKKGVAEIVVESLKPIQERYHELTSDIAELDRLLDKHADKAREVACKTVKDVKEAMGFVTR